MALLKAIVWGLLATIVVTVGFFVSIFLTPILIILGVGFLIAFVRWDIKQQEERDRLN